MDRDRRHLIALRGQRHFKSNRNYYNGNTDETRIIKYRRITYHPKYCDNVLGLVTEGIRGYTLSKLKQNAYTPKNLRPSVCVEKCVIICIRPLKYLRIN